MRRVTCQFDTVAPDGRRFAAGVSHVCPEHVAAEWFRADPPAVRISTLKSYERPYFGQCLHGGQSLWVSRGAGFGDQLIMSGVLAEIKRRWPASRLVFSTLPAARALFGCGEPDSEADKVFQFAPEIAPFDEWAAFDYHKIVEEIIELDREPDQTNIWETHFRFFGLWPVAPEHCRPINILTQKARDMAGEFLSSLRPHPSPFLLYQLASTSPIRSQSPARVTECLAALRDAFPGHVVIAVGGREQAHIEIPAGVVSAVERHPRLMVGLIERAAAVVCPDSCVNHIAAGLGDASTPVVSLWSSFDPARRVSTYPNQFPIYHPLDCSPCFAHEMQTPPLGCPLFRGHCRGLDAITPAQIVARLREAMSVHPITVGVFP